MLSGGGGLDKAANFSKFGKKYLTKIWDKHFHTELKKQNDKNTDKGLQQAR